MLDRKRWCELLAREPGVLPALQEAARAGLDESNQHGGPSRFCVCDRDGDSGLPTLIQARLTHGKVLWFIAYKGKLHHAPHPYDGLQEHDGGFKKYTAKKSKFRHDLEYSWACAQLDSYPTTDRVLLHIPTPPLAVPPPLPNPHIAPPTPPPPPHVALPIPVTLPQALAPNYEDEFI